MNLSKQFNKTIQVLIFFTLNNKKEQKITSLFTIVVMILPLGVLVTVADKSKFVQRKKCIVIAWKTRCLLVIKCSLASADQCNSFINQIHCLICNNRSTISYKFLQKIISFVLDSLIFSTDNLKLH